MSEIILEACNIKYHYDDGTSALDDLNIQIEKGKKTAIIGGNGAGKSTLFLNFNAVLKPQKGHILFDNKKVYYDTPNINRLRKNIGLVFQEPDHQVFSSSIYQEIAFGPLNFGWPKDEVKEKVQQVMELMQIEHLKDRPTHYLSYGQKKQVAIASILVLEPKVIILDEPTAGLDPMHTRKLLELLNGLSEKGITLIVATHDVNFAYSWAESIHVMKQGKVIRSGTPEEIFSDEAILDLADMEMPYLVSLTKKYNQISNKDQKKLPKTEDELIQIMKGGLE